MAKGNGDDNPVKINVVDRRHHAHPDDAGEAGAPSERYPTIVEQLRARTDAAERKAREAIERAEGEIDAVRERLQRDLERRVTQGKSALMTSVLEVIDNLDRAARHADETAPAIAAGIDLVRQQLLSILKAEGVEPIETLGLTYDPHVAEAVITEPVGPDRDNLVVEEIQRGYRYGETVLRPARVKVGKASD
ncbi:MAG TPA: nucleotide exchange factor GrpE [Candidatus Polarisedimenticolia bacterium]|jgi:molecular chaperone GrpE